MVCSFPYRFGLKFVSLAIKVYVFAFSSATCGWLAGSQWLQCTSVPLLTESSLYSVFTQRIPGSVWQDHIPPPCSEIIVGKRVLTGKRDHKLRGKPWQSSKFLCFPLGGCAAKTHRSPAIHFNARGLIVWENNLGKWNKILFILCPKRLLHQEEKTFNTEKLSLWQFCKVDLRVCLGVGRNKITDVERKRRNRRGSEGEMRRSMAVP